ncbi:hypothetical protein D3C81_1816350 [compost metagenome]
MHDPEAPFAVLMEVEGVEFFLADAFDAIHGKALAGIQRQRTAAVWVGMLDKAGEIKIPPFAITRIPRPH